MRLHALALCLLFSACNAAPTSQGCGGIADPPPNELDGGFGGSGGFGGGGGAGFGGGISISGDSSALVLLVGQPVTVPLSVAATVANFCVAATPMAPTGANSSVLGPDNLPVTSTQTGVGLNDGVYVDSLTFTPEQPGDYHLVATFEPDLGVAQLDVPAAFDRSTLSAQSTYDLLVLGDCGQFAVTELGTLLCGDNQTVVAYRDGGRVDSQSGNIIAVDGSSIWLASLNMTVVSHFIDTGTGTLEPGTPSEVDTPSGVTALVPGDDGLLVLMLDRAALYTTSDGGVSETQEWPAPGLNAAARSGNDLLAQYESSPGLYANPAEGSTLELIDGTKNLVCVAYGPEGMWMVDQTTGVLELFTPGNHSPSATLFGLIGWNPPPMFSALAYGVAAVTTANTTQTFTATWDSTLNAPVMSMWGPNTSVYFAGNGWTVAKDFSTRRVTVTQVPTP